MQFRQIPQIKQIETAAEKNLFWLKAFAIVGFLAICILSAWGIIQLGRKLPTIGGTLSAAAVSLSSLFTPAEHITITIPSANIPSDEPFTLTWEHTNKRAEGTYTVTFACRDGLSMRAVTITGTYQSVFCNTPFNLSGATNAMSLIPSSSAVRFLDVPVTISFTRLSDGKITASTDTALTIINEKINVDSVATPATSTTPRGVAAGAPVRNTYTVTQAGRVSDPNGRPDLSVTIVAVGILDPVTSLFTPSSVIHESDRGAVKFVVENLGTKEIESWNFNAVLPTYPMHIFMSSMQPVLGPGDRIEYTMGFDSVSANTTAGILTLNVDPSNRIFNEVTENNNISKSSFTIRK